MKKLIKITLTSSLLVLSLGLLAKESNDSKKEIEIKDKVTNKRAECNTPQPEGCERWSERQCKCLKRKLVKVEI